MRSCHLAMPAAYHVQQRTQSLCSYDASIILQQSLQRSCRGGLHTIVARVGGCDELQSDWPPSMCCAPSPAMTQGSALQAALLGSCPDLYQGRPITSIQQAPLSCTGEVSRVAAVLQPCTRGVRVVNFRHSPATIPPSAVPVPSRSRP